MKCNNCGYENKEGAKFCNQCGVKLYYDMVKDDTSIVPEITKKEDNKVVEKTGYIREIKFDFIAKLYKLSVKKKIIIVTLAIIILIGGSISWEKYKNYQYETGYNLSYEDKKLNIGTQLLMEKYEKAKQLSNAYKVHENDMDKIIQIYKDNKGKVYTLSDAEQILSKQEYAKACTIEKVNIKNKSYSSKYVDVEITVKNNTNQNINYVKVGLDFTKSGQVVKSDWTNDNATIKPNATQKLTKMVDSSGWDQVQAEVTQWEK